MEMLRRLVSSSWRKRQDEREGDLAYLYTALEDCPEEARGIISGMLQQGYAFGYLLATVFARAFVDTVGHGWRPVSHQFDFKSKALKD